MDRPDAPLPPLRLIAWEVTRTCNLKCRHCRAAASSGAYEGELTTEECEKVLRSLSALGSPIVILTGGEPMTRPDIYHLAETGTKLGLRMVMAPCGELLNNDSCRRLIESGIKRISLSVDGATARSHDAFRGVPGAYDSVMRGIDAAKAAGLEFQINTTVTKLNVQELPAILDLSLRLGAVSFHPFLLVPTGRGKDLSEYELSPEEYERVLTWVAGHQDREGLSFKPTCAPHFYRIIRQQGRHAPAGTASGHPHVHGLNSSTKGCLGGQGFAFLSHTGTVQICGFLDISAGDIRQAGYDFGRIWRDSPLFAQMRAIDGYHGRCGICEFRRVCGGCRARAYAVTGDYLGEEPFCLHQPRPGRISTGATP